MDAGQSVLICGIIFAFLLLFTTADQKNITAESIQDVTLPCRPPSTNNDLAEWSRADLGDEYVLFYWDGHIVADHQHHSFKNRVDLQDRQMKDGDVSLILNNVTTADTGTYECRVFMKETRSWKSITSIYLSVVDPPGQTGGHTEDGGKEDGGKEDGIGRRYYAGLVAFGLLLAVIIVVVAVVISKKRKKDPPLPDEEVKKEMI